MQSHSGPPDLSDDAGRVDPTGSAPSRYDNNTDNTKGGTRRLAMFYLAHWPDDSLAAIIPTLRQYAVIPQES
ncbi:hypothetical protein HQ520_17460 [bacterium]|nr:hypothetical protein [bacterium]